ncbi:MAG: hypothetical protein NVS3B7_04830 [Candidatus Elarobacter sp.]
MMRRDASGLRDRVLAAIEVPALGMWMGMLIGFAFLTAPIAFREFAPLDTARFAAFTANNVFVLTTIGYVLGGLAVIAALLRAVTAGERIWDAIRIALVLLALALSTYEARAVVPEMKATVDLHGAAYHALHQRSSQVYGGVLLLGVVALVLAAGRREDD